jgi:hypothetical protein
MPGDFLDLSSDPPPQRGRDTSHAKGRSEDTRSRRYVGVHFNCCDVYTRIYINRQQTAYVGHCPRCSRRVELKIGPGGTDARFFTVH